MNAQMTMNTRMKPTAILENDITPEGSDYEMVRRVIEKISLDYRDQPSLEVLAEEVGETPTGLQKLFTRWAGLSPKAFLQAVTLDHARKLLDSGMPLLETSFELGMSGPGRLHDLFVTHEAMSPGDYKTRGDGPHHPLRLPHLALRHRLDHGHRPRAGRPRLQRSRRRAGGLRRHVQPLAERQLCRGHDRHRALCGAHLRSDAVARRPAAARGDDRYRFPAPRLGGAVAHPDGQGLQLFLDRRQASAHRAPVGRWVRRSAPTRCPSSCPATARSANPERSPAITGA